jgi:two-component system response regulator HydG
VGATAPIRQLHEDIDAAARSQAKVLISGESGVGKEVVARLIHRHSARSRAPLVTINCAGIADSLLESELFGHVRGSFTHAERDRDGLLAVANGGTVFLDEVGEMSLRMQAVLLRFLESGEIQRVGIDRPERALDVRIIAATNRNMREHIAANAFREDLYFRLNVIHLMIPPLRERRDDIPSLVHYFLRELACRADDTAPEVSPEAMARLQAYRWPGNVRELRNVVERMMLRRRGEKSIRPEHLPREISTAPSTISSSPRQAPAVSVTDSLYQRMTHGGESFWNVVYEPFMARDLRREHLRKIIERGLLQTRGNYTLLVQLFNMGGHDYKRFMAFLRAYDCHLPFQQFRSMTPPVATRV